MSIRAKMTLINVVGMYGGCKAIFTCQYDTKKNEEDVGFSKATPSGMAEFQIDNPEASKQLHIGKSYYFDITPAE